MKNKKTRRRNLAICMLVALIGVAICILSLAIWDFRYDVGYSVPESTIMLYVKAFGIIILEIGTMFLGVSLTAFGLAGAYGNVKKLVR